jgi:hypothetical protein
MTTLYDQLGVGPKDDQDSVKKAFRQAIKASHPDIHPGDPDAESRFRQIVRANAILSDPELRVTYDRMLAFERQQAEANAGARRGALSATMDKIYADAIPIVVLVFVMLGGYAVFLQVSKVSDAAIGPTHPRLPPHAAVAPDVLFGRAEFTHERTTAGAAEFTATNGGGEAAVAPAASVVSDVFAEIDRHGMLREAPARTELPHERTIPGASELRARDGGGETVVAAAPAAGAGGGDAIAAAGKDGAPQEAPARTELPRERTTPGASELTARDGGGETIVAAAPAAGAGGGDAIAAAGKDGVLYEAAGRTEPPYERTTPSVSELTATHGGGETVNAAPPAANAISSDAIATTGKDGAPHASARIEHAHERTTPSASELPARDDAGQTQIVVAAAPATNAISGDGTLHEAAARIEHAHERTTLGASEPAARHGGGEAAVAAAPAANAISGDTIAAISKDGAPRDAKFFRERGILAYRTGDFDRAIADFDLAIKLDPNFEAAYVDRGTVFYRLGQRDRAIADIAEAKRIADANRAKELSSRRK